MSRTTRVIFLVRTLAMLSLTAGCAATHTMTRPVDTQTLTGVARIDTGGGFGVAEETTQPADPEDSCEADLRAYPYCVVGGNPLPNGKVN